MLNGLYIVFINQNRVRAFFTSALFSGLFPLRGGDGTLDCLLLVSSGRIPPLAARLSAPGGADRRNWGYKVMSTMGPYRVVEALLAASVHFPAGKGGCGHTRLCLAAAVELGGPRREAADVFEVWAISSRRRLAPRGPPGGQLP